MSKLHYGFLDESGVVEEQAQKGRHFIVSIIVIGNPGELKHVIKRARQRMRGKYKTHQVFHAHKEDPGFIKLVLKELARQELNIVVGLWDKSRYHTVGDDEHNQYAQQVARTVVSALERWPQLSLTVHKRYTLPAEQIAMNRIIEKYAEEHSQGNRFLAIDHRTAVECRELELADAVAWAVFQKYNQHDPSFYDIIKEKIQKENRLAA